MPGTQLPSLRDRKVAFLPVVLLQEYQLTTSPTYWWDHKLIQGNCLLQASRIKWRIKKIGTQDTNTQVPEQLCKKGVHLA